MRILLFLLAAIFLCACFDNTPVEVSGSEKTENVTKIKTSEAQIAEDVSGIDVSPLQVNDGPCQCSGSAPSKTVTCSKPDGTRFTRQAKCWQKKTALTRRSCGIVCASSFQVCSGISVTCR